MSRAKDLNKEKIARSFLRGKNTYDRHAGIQLQVSRKLVERLKEYPEIDFSKVLEIGCCTGTLTELLLRTFSIEKLYLNDLVPDFYDDVVKRLGGLGDVEKQPLFGDIEKLPLPAELDLVVSSATFQWLADLGALFRRISASLKDSGFLAFSIFGPGTLSEFREITGIGLEYTPIGSIRAMLEENFSIQEEFTHKDRLFFSSPREVLKHLQATGVGGVREYRWTPGRLRNFEDKYLELFGGASGVPVTYVSAYIVASKKG
jgi:malonyl-CoA O-methyltransferase